MNADSDHRVVGFDPLRIDQDISLGTRIDERGIKTYHLIASEPNAGLFVEKIYNDEHKLIRMQKRTPAGRSETFYDPRSGATLRVVETASLNDGNSLTKEVVYGQTDRSNESISVVAPNGQLVRKVERRFVGSRTTYQGQTEYTAHGAPATTVNHHMEESTGRLMRREQIQWRKEGQRLLTESFCFDRAGGLQKYSKTLHHANAGPFIEEIQIFDSRTQCLLQREISAYNLTGLQTRMDVLTYNDAGEIAERTCRFFDKEGQEIAVNNTLV